MKMGNICDETRQQGNQGLKCCKCLIISFRLRALALHRRWPRPLLTILSLLNREITGAYRPLWRHKVQYQSHENRAETHTFEFMLASVDRLDSLRSNQ
jgi:hypothetical protein